MDKQICVTCQMLKPFNDFNKDKSRTIGYRSECRECQKQRKKKWDENNRQRVLDYNAEYNKMHPEKVKEQKKRYREKHSEAIKLYKVEYRLNHLEEIRERDRLYYIANRDRIILRQQGYTAIHREQDRARSKKYYETHITEATEYNKQYRIDHKQEIAARNKRWAENNRDKLRQAQKKWRLENIDRARLNGRVTAARRRARILAIEGFHTKEEIMMQYNIQDGLCFWCSSPVGRVYDVDHIVPISRGGTDWISNLAVACPSCNRSKHNKLPDEWLAHKALSIDSRKGKTRHK